MVQCDKCGKDSLHLRDIGHSYFIMECPSLCPSCINEWKRLYERATKNYTKYRNKWCEWFVKWFADYIDYTQKEKVIFT